LPPLASHARDPFTAQVRIARRRSGCNLTMTTGAGGTLSPGQT
jgi:hypothetical protein